MEKIVLIHLPVQRIFTVRHTVPDIIAEKFAFVNSKKVV